MANKVITAEARITARDATAGVFEQVARRIGRINQAAAKANATAARAARAQERSTGLAARVAGVASKAPGMAIGALGRYAAPVAGAVASGAAVKEFAAWDRRLTRIGITADESAEGMRTVNAEVVRLAQETAQPIDKVVGGLESLVAQGRSLKDSMAFLPAVAKTAAAAGAEVEDIAKTADSVGSQLKVSSGEMQTAFDIMAYGGKAGQFELKDMARYLPSLGAAAGAVGFQGTKGLSELVAMLQVLRKGAGTSEEAVSSMNNILAKMESDKTLKGLNAEIGKGDDFAEKRFERARKSGENLVEVFEELITLATKGDKSKIGKIIDDMEFKRGVLALMTYKGEWQALSRAAQQKGPGVVVKDLGRVTQDTQSKLDQLSNSFTNLMRVGGETLVNLGAHKGLGNLARDLQLLNDELDRMNKGERTNTERTFNALKNFATTGQAVDQPQADLEKARQEKETRDQFDRRRTWLSGAISREEERKALEARNWGTTSAVGKSRQAAVQKKVDQFRQELAEIEEAWNARERVNMDLTEYRGAQQRLARLRIDKPGEIRPIEPGWKSFGFHGAGGSKGQETPWDNAGSNLPATAPIPAPAPNRPKGFDSIADLLGSGKITATVEKPVDVTGKVEAEIKGEAKVAVTVTVNGDGRVTSLRGGRDGNVSARVGSTAGGAAYGGGGATGKGGE